MTSRSPSVDAQYGDLLFDLLVDGAKRPDRTGVGTLSLFGRKLEIDLGAGFPLLTTKRLHTRSIVTELAWMLQGRSNVRWLQDHGVTIWDEWADDAGNLGPVYGAQWRSWPAGAPGAYIDQLKGILRQLQEDPYGRRHIVSAWNVAELSRMALPPCHLLFQFYVTNDRRLDCQLYQRSADVFLGLPFNIASYALLTCLVAHVQGLRPGVLHHVIGDAHLYLNHLDQAREQLQRQPKPLPRLILPAEIDLFDFEPEAIGFAGYEPHPHIPGEVAR